MAVAQQAAGPTETISLGDGTTMQLARVPGVDEETWNEMKAYLASNPDVAGKLRGFSKNPDAIRGWMQTQAIAQHYSEKLGAEDPACTGRIKALENDPELAPIFAEIKEGGIEAVMKFWNDEELMLKFSQKMGGLPEELKPAMQKLYETPLSLHEAARDGDLRACQEFIRKGQPIDAQDSRGVTPLGYAIGKNRIAVVKLLLDGRANPHSVDARGNCGLHYAAGYGRKELVEYLVRTNANVNQVNAEGQTPVAAASINRQTAILEILRAQGGR